MTPRSQLLYLEDDLADVELLQGALQADGLACDITRVDTECGFLAALQQDGFDLILADYTLPSFDDLSALRMARRQKRDLPFIFVSGTIGGRIASANPDASFFSALGEFRSRAVRDPVLNTIDALLTRKSCDCEPVARESSSNPVVPHRSESFMPSRSAQCYSI